MEVYKNRGTNEIVYKKDAQEYAMEMLGIKIKPKEKDGTYTLDQMEIMQDIEDYYFSGNWTKDELEEEQEDVFFTKQFDYGYDYEQYLREVR